MKNRIPRLLFDQEDHDLLVVVNDILHRDPSRSAFRNLLNPFLHPHGIKEMAASRELRIAYAVAHILSSLEIGEAKDRLSALRSLREEVLSSAKSHLRKNTARVLLQIMKKLVRSQGDYLSQLKLAHDFRLAASGKPRIVREQLRRNHLLEMSEEWNQIATDDHVHDVNTKGRKSPSHLIMDAWIKGIRRLKIIYYHYVRPDVAEELLEAAHIMGIRVRIGIELNPRFRNRPVQFIWAPRGLLDTQDYLTFLKEPKIQAFLEEGKRAADYTQRHVFSVLENFNSRHLETIREAYGLEMDALDPDEFRAFVGIGQVSVLHLSEFIHTNMLPFMQARTDELRKRYEAASQEERAEIQRIVDEMNTLDSETIAELFLHPELNEGIPETGHPFTDADEPELLRLSPRELLDKLAHLHSGFSITLGLSGLRIADVIEILYESSGMITHLENFNLKDYLMGEAPPYEEINDLQRALNKADVIALKRILHDNIDRLRTSQEPDRGDRAARLTFILKDIESFLAYYQHSILKSRVGSDSSGRSRHLYGMGMVVLDTLPTRTLRDVRRESYPSRFMVPISTSVYLRVNYFPREIASPFLKTLVRLAQRLPGLHHIGKKRHEEWELVRDSTSIGETGNVLTLGGIDVERTNHLSMHPPEMNQKSPGLSWRYLNSTLKSWIKVCSGFLPAFLTFYLTQDWWVLAWFGAFIWFGITGLRNILQSVLGGGGLSRSPLLQWNDYVSWERLSDSLLFTGFSVPLLDFLIKTTILDEMLGITVATSPMILYTVIALVNGLYISSHNAFRGFPRGVVIGNFFRTVLSIPLAIAINLALGGILSAMGLVGVDLMLQKWAAVISKAASDTVGGIIEGLADRFQNIRIRLEDYREKLNQLFSGYARIEIFFPESAILEVIESPDDFFDAVHKDSTNLEQIFIIHALDLLYFWMYQPRARSALKMIIHELSDEERKIFIRTQSVLSREREISQLFLDGFLGKNFTRPLSFFLDRSGQYLEIMNRELQR
ncbi:MAG TPA: hypothetical protein ENN34_11815 [Deltaproteobacteria bacterium]|nr:hypothetical protein [Deltaproteobacteria bacterium]